MKKVLTLSLIGAALFSTAAMATTINIRHEWKPDWGKHDDAHADRIAVSHRFSNGIGYEVEAKYKSNNDDAWGDPSGNGSQANISYRWKMNDTFTLTPQFKLEVNDDRIGYQSNLTLGYKVNSDISTSVRYRYHYENYKSSADKPNTHYNRITLAASYNGIKDWGLGLSTDYTFKQEGQEVRDGDDNGISEINAKIAYKGFEGGWAPFVELGVTPEDKTSAGNDEKDDWRPRIRVGVTYTY